MTILQKLSVLSDSLNADSDNFQHINVACQFFMNSLPLEIAREYFAEVEVTDGDGVACGTKYASVIRKDKICRKISNSHKRLAKVSSSQYFAVETDPVFYKSNGKLFILPEPTATDKGYVEKIPLVFIPDGANSALDTIPNVPENSDHVILLYAGFLILSTQFRDVRSDFPTFPTFNDTINTLSISFPAIGDITVDTSLSFADLDALNAPDISSSDFDIDASALSKAMDALQNAYEFVGSLEGTEINSDADANEVPKGAFWLDDEDPEMVQSSTQLAAQEVNRANSYFNNQLSKLNSYSSYVNAKVSEFQNKVRLETEKLNAKVQRMQVEAQANNLELQKHEMSIQEVNTELQKFQIDVQQRFQQNQQLLERFSQNLQSFQLKYQQLFQESVSLYERYSVEFRNFLGIYGSQQGNRKS